MNIIVCIKQVPNTTQVRINPETNTLIREGVESIINPFDQNAIEAALQLKELHNARVIVIDQNQAQKLCEYSANKQEISFFWGM